MSFYFPYDKYQEVITIIDHKSETESKVYQDNKIETNTIKKVAASELINCINSNLDTNNLPDSINNVIKEINIFYNQSYDYFSFKYKDLYTGFTVSYNENQNIFTTVL